LLEENESAPALPFRSESRRPADIPVAERNAAMERGNGFDKTKMPGEATIAGKRT
jgi:hypothetical protein